MALTLLAGCGGGDKEPAGPVKTFDGRKFSIAHSRYFPRKNEDGTFISQLDEEWQAAYDDLEARLDIKLEHVSLEGETLELLTSAAMSGMVLADLIQAHQRNYWPAAKANAILAVDGDELQKAGLNPFDETRWFVPAVKETKLFDKHWGVMVASKYVAVPSGYFVCFNKELVASAGDYDLYQLTRDKKWTWDVYLEIARKVTKDTTGDGVPDIWGTGATAWGSEAISNGVDYIGQDENGKWVLTIGSPAGIRALQFLYDMNFGDGTRLDESSGVCRQAFADGTIAFNWAHMGHIDGPGQTIYNSQHEYGIVPMPMGPDATEYYSMSSTNDALLIQTTHDNLEDLVAIMNEWALVVNHTENYMDVLNDGRCRTEEDKEMMINYVLPSYKLNYGGINAEIWDLVDEGIISGVSYGGLTPTAAIEQFEPEIQAALDAFFDQ
jgi:ABC-type glycerol-3-phosphate transport system substrate-binding protein